MTDLREVPWERFAGDYAKKGRSGPCAPTLGITPDKCPCCDDRRVLVAAVAEDGSEIIIGLSVEMAQLALTAFAAAVAAVLPAGAKN